MTTDVDDLPWAEREVAERKGRELVGKHRVASLVASSAGGRNETVDAIVELLDTQGVRVDATDEVAMREIIGTLFRAISDVAVAYERERILTGLGQAGARLSAGELAVIGRPRGSWWFSG